MGMDIHVNLYKYDEERNQFMKMTLYTWDYKEGKHKEVYLFPGRDHSMFEGMKHGDETDGYGYFPTRAISLNSFFDPDRKELEEDMSAQGYFDFWEINLAEMALYCKEHPVVTDYDAYWDDEDPNFVKPTKKNPICGLYEEICNYARFVDEWNWDFEPLSSYKVVIYFDW